MKILFIRPPKTIYIRDILAHDLGAGLPLGIMYIASFLEKNSFNTEIFDALVSFDSRSMRKTIEDRALSKTNVEPIHFGTDWRGIENLIIQRNPDIVGISNPFTEERFNAYRTASIVKGISNDILTVMGGPFCSTNPQTVLNESSKIDLVVVGEGERTMLDISKWLEGGIPLQRIKGIVYRNTNGEIKYNESRPYIKELDSLPFPAYHLVDMERYFEVQEEGYQLRMVFKNNKKVPMITSRGCPFNCIFCTVHLSMGKKWRYHSPEYILNHIDYLIKEYDIKHIDFEDDNATMDLKRFDAVLDGLIDRHYNITWDTPNGIRADKIDRELLVKAQKSQCAFLRIGIESGSKRVLREIIRKNLDLDAVVNVAKWCKEIGVRLYAFFIIGFPGETRKEIKKTRDFSLFLWRKYSVYSSIGIVKPLLGTKLRDICIESNVLTKPTMHPVMEELNYSKQEMIKTSEFDLDYLYKMRKSHERRKNVINIQKGMKFLLKNTSSLKRLVNSLLKHNKNTKYNFFQEVKHFMKDEYARTIGIL